MEIYNKKRFITFVFALIFFLVSIGMGYLILKKDKNNETISPSTQIKTRYVEDAEANKEISLDKGIDGLYQMEKTYESKIFTADFEFNAVTPVWIEDIPPKTSLDLYLRLGKNDAWSDWLKMVGEGTGGKDGAKRTEKSPEVPFFYEGNHIQYKVILKTSDKKVAPTLKSIKIKYIDSKTKNEGNIVGFLKNISNPPEVNAVSAYPHIITRAGWGCPEPNSSPGWKPEYSPVKKFIIHHTAGPTSQDPKADMRAIWDDHTKTKGWGDIGYNYVIDKQGNIYEGRYGGLRVVAGHTKGYNVGSMGIAIMGNYTSEEPTEASLQALSRLIIWKSQSFGIDLGGSDLFQGTEGHPAIVSDNIAGHKNYFCTSGCENIDDDKNGTGNDWNNTTCPGTLLQYLDQLRTGHIDISAPAPSTLSCPAIDPGGGCQYCDKATKVQKRLSCLGMWGISFKEKRKDDDPTLGQNRLALIDGINEYIADKYPKSPFRKLNKGNPGALFVSASEQDGGAGINPLILLAVSAATTNMGTVSDPVMKSCGNPWNQKPPIPSPQSKEAVGDNSYKSPSCTDSDGNVWYEYNRNHEINEDMIYAQAEIMRNTYTQDYTIRSLGGNENNDPPGNDPGFISKYNEYNKGALNPDIFLQKMEELIDVADKTLKCSSYGDGGGDLANADALSEEGIACVIENASPTSARFPTPPLAPYVKEIYDAAQEFSVNPLFALGMANQDSSLGTAGAGADNKNPGNIGCRGDNYSQAGVTAGCADFATFNTFGDGMIAEIWLLRSNYLDTGQTDPLSVAEKYAPRGDGDNDPDAHAQHVVEFMEKYGAMCGAL